jgi:hypothetical protein
MAESNPNIEWNPDEVRRRIASTPLKTIMPIVDAKYDSPEVRAQKVFDLLRENGFTNWDGLCFAVEFMGALSPTYPWLTEPAREASRLVYTAHYYFADEILK